MDSILKDRTNDSPVRIKNPPTKHSNIIKGLQARQPSLLKVHVENSLAWLDKSNPENFVAFEYMQPWTIKSDDTILESFSKLYHAPEIDPTDHQSIDQENSMLFNQPISLQNLKLQH